MQNFNSDALKKVKVRNGVYAWVYPQLVNIEGEKFVGYSVTDAIRIWRSNNPAYRRSK